MVGGNCHNDVRWAMKYDFDGFDADRVGEGDCIGQIRQECDNLSS